MRKILFSISIVFIFVSFLFVENFAVASCENNAKLVDKESIINKVTGFGFISRNIAEAIIQKEINEELDSNVKANLEIFSVKNLRNGIFKSLALKSKQLKYKALSAKDVTVSTIDSYNKILYKNGKLRFPTDLDFKFTATITNEDIKNVINSIEFQNELARSTLSYRGVNGVKFETPEVYIEDGFLNFTMPITSFLIKKPINIKFKANIEINEGKILLKNITFNSKRNIIGSDILEPVISAINPLAFELNSINGKFCNISVTNAKIVGNSINADGILRINKNYGG